ncbi:hypothetical protein IFT75_02750 [Pseudomonas sp. CFBP 8758]|uniref:hypothetical protein n=1 Tax=Pseudomonas sp. CFBP 8758 TaxID=2775286 RepID=UPI000F05A5AD|nr:hypothetical protein [Pseudomonas sp. CFBP 8758]MBD8592319.1 hypothetical protein [Pseudomonas sp. CFBP 8758]
MNLAQQALVDRTLRAIGWISLVIGALILVVGLANNLDLEDLFDTEEAALIVWPPFVIGIVALWARAYMRAGRISI